MLQCSESPEMPTRILFLRQKTIPSSPEILQYTMEFPSVSLMNKRVTTKEIKVGNRRFHYIFIFNVASVEILHHLAQIHII